MSEEAFLMTERWRGGVDEKLRAIAEDVSRQGRTLEGFQTVVSDRVTKIEIQVSMLATRIAMFSAVSAIIGSSIASVVVGLLLKK